MVNKNKKARGGFGEAAARRRGHSLLEMTCVVGLLSFVTLALFPLFSTANTLFDAGDAKADIEEQGRRALMSISAEIKEAGYVTDSVTGASYPYIFSDGAAAGRFAAYSHSTPSQCREIVFRMVKDLDGDGFKTDSASGDIEWGADEISYLLVAGADGVNRLERRVNNGSPRIVARFVERVRFDDSGTDSSIPYGQIRVTLEMKKVSPEGRAIRTTYSTLVRMRNYEE